MLPRRFLALVIFTSAVCLSGRPVVPVETFTAAPDFSQARLSPDGEAIAYIATQDGQPWLMVMEIDRRTVRRIDPGNAYNGLRREVAAFQWIGDRRIAFTTTVWDGAEYTGLSAVDRDGKNWKAISGPDAGLRDLFLAMEIQHAFNDETQSVLMVNRGLFRGKGLNHPDIVRVNTLTGVRETVVKNPGTVVHWVTDRAGVVRLGITRLQRQFGAIYRESENAPWRELRDFSPEAGEVVPLGFDYLGRRLLVAADTPERRRGLYYFDPAEETLGELVAAHPEYDIVPAFDTVSLDGGRLTGPITSELSETVVGIRYLTEGPRVAWFDPALAELQAVIDATLTDTVNIITSRSRDEKRLLIMSYSDRDPGTYYLLDLRGGEPDLKWLGTRLPNFPVGSMAQMFPIKYPARDGEMIHGYVTLPVGEQRTGLPLVVMPHGGPTARDVWGFNPLVQFLANRGYAVLQMNFRGSPGFGTEFFEKGKREIGRGMQNDIEDGTRWAITSGLADPRRIAIVGGSFGGFSALFALGHNPDLYACGVSFAGVTDWNDIVRNRTGEEYKFAYEHFQEWIGDPRIDAAFLRSISPINYADRIVAPVFLVQGNDDRIVPPRQAKRMEAALKAVKRPPRVLYFGKEGHGLRDPKNRTRYFRELESFLATHL